MHKFISGIVLVALVAAGGWYLYTNKGSDAAQERTAEAMGTYPYVCENGSEFSMTPSEDMSTITVTAGAQGMFTGTVVLDHMGDGAHYEGDHQGTLVVAGGAGEEMSLAVGSESTSCNPKPNPEMAPWNWGDAAEGWGSVKQDVHLIVSESIVGKWKSASDAKFVRQFKDGGVVADWYEGEVRSQGTWKVFSKEQPLSVPFTLAENTVYLQLKMAGTQSETLNFKVNKLTPETLELTYMDRGGVLVFSYVE